MKKKLVLHLLLFLVCALENIVLAVQGPASSPISTPISASMAAFSPAGIQLGGEEHKKMDPTKKMLLALILACSSLGAIISSLFCLWIYYRKNSSKSSKNGAKSSDGEKGNGLAPYLGKFKSMRTVSKEGYASFMDYKILEKATNKFHHGNILGEGGFGCVYKAQFNDSSYAAVKKLDCASQDAEKEYENEVGLLCRFKHSNIISLLGYSSDNDTRFIVYELMENGSLETQLHGPSHGSSLTWQRRMKIALDTARGLEYLHEHCNPPVIHRDLKSSNILLDLDFNAKSIEAHFVDTAFRFWSCLSDFGLAVTDAAPNKNNLKLSGTLGYVAPEYLLDGKLTDKSDVYAFGVVLLELLLGRKPVEKLAPAQCQSIVTWVGLDLMLVEVAAVAVLCVQPEPSYRPLITDVLHSLIPLVPMELGGTLRVTQPTAP
ncbi:hypothetical protein GOBAR_DD18709 [Gossypium barbadense]|nr:hypothetical protein GOBAR_DD18709 [Gossypium barbadense]